MLLEAINYQEKLMIFKMKQKDKIFDLFQQNQHKLEERPSLQAWNKLERRLDQKSRKSIKPKFSFYGIAMMAAAAVALVFFVTTIADVAQEVNSRKAVVIKETTPTKNIKLYSLVAEQNFREKYKSILENTVEEGKTGRLIVANNKAIRPFLIPKKS